MDVSIVILNYKQKGLVKQCIKGIELSGLSLDYEIILVDNNSDDSVLEMVRENFPHAKTLEAKKNKGMGAGNNLGMKKANGDFILILNPDIAMVPGAVEEMYKFMKNNPSAGIVGPRLINPDGSIQFSARRFYGLLTPLFRRTFLGQFSFAKKHLRYYLMQDEDHKKRMKVDWIFGACLFIRKEFLQTVGFFDERFFLYFEDCDLCRRFWKKGYDVWYLGDVELVHYHDRLSARRKGVVSVFSKGGRMHIVSGIRYFIKYLGEKKPPY